jgi:hypothetical protein
VSALYRRNAILNFEAPSEFINAVKFSAMLARQDREDVSTLFQETVQNDSFSFDCSDVEFIDDESTESPPPQEIIERKRRKRI